MESNPYANLEAMREIEDVPTPEPSTMTDPAFRHLLATVHDLQNQIQADREESRRKDDEFRLIIQSLINKIDTGPAATPAVAEPAPIRQITKTVKLRDPEPFTGKPSKLFTFLTDCHLKFEMEPQSFPTEFNKIGWAASHLSGTAKLWWTTQFEAFRNGKCNIPELQSFDAFEAKLNERFGDLALVRTKGIELCSLRQTTSVAHYATEFIAISQFLNCTDDTLREQFELGLKDHVKDGLSYIPTAPATLQELIDIANKVDIRRHQYSQTVKKPTHVTSSASRSTINKSIENKGKSATPKPSWAHPAPSSQAAAPPQSKSVLPTQTPDGTTPMEIDSTGRKVLAAAEKQRRFDNNLCMYCGGSDHHVSTCPKLARINALFPPAFITEFDSSDSSSTNDSAQE